MTTPTPITARVGEPTPIRDKCSCGRTMRRHAIMWTIGDPLQMVTLFCDNCRKVASVSEPYPASSSTSPAPAAEAICEWCVYRHTGTLAATFSLQEAAEEWAKSRGGYSVRPRTPVADGPTREVLKQVLDTLKYAGWDDDGPEDQACRRAHNLLAPYVKETL